MDVFEEWLSRKLHRQRSTLRSSKTVEGKFVKIYGPRADYAWLRMTGEPGDIFGFRSKVCWPEHSAEYEAAVLDGILDELLCTGVKMAVLNAHFTLEEIKWHPVDGSCFAFYQAARLATQSILSLNEYPGNVVVVG